MRYRMLVGYWGDLAVEIALHGGWDAEAPGALMLCSAAMARASPWTGRASGHDLPVLAWVDDGRIRLQQISPPNHGATTVWEDVSAVREAMGRGYLSWPVAGDVVRLRDWDPSRAAVARWRRATGAALGRTVVHIDGRTLRVADVQPLEGWEVEHALLRRRTTTAAIRGA